MPSAVTVTGESAFIGCVKVTIVSGVLTYLYRMAFAIGFACMGCFAGIAFSIIRARTRLIPATAHGSATSGEGITIVGSTIIIVAAGHRIAVQTEVIVCIVTVGAIQIGATVIVVVIVTLIIDSGMG